METNVWNITYQDESSILGSEISISGTYLEQNDRFVEFGSMNLTKIVGYYLINKEYVDKLNVEFDYSDIMDYDSTIFFTVYSIALEKVLEIPDVDNAFKAQLENNNENRLSYRIMSHDGMNDKNNLDLIARVIDELNIDFSVWDFELFKDTFIEKNKSIKNVEYNKIVF